jgi:predicted nucleic acid-binding protein
LLREKFAKQLKVKSVTPGDIADGYAALASIVMPAVISSTIVHDPPDDAVLATALAARVDLVVSGDKRLRNLKNFQGIPIVTAAEALTRIAQR